MEIKSTKEKTIKNQLWDLDESDESTRARNQADMRPNQHKKQSITKKPSPEGEGHQQNKIKSQVDNAVGSVELHT